MSKVIILAGDGGTGKTDQSDRFMEPILKIDAEYPRALNHWKQAHPDLLVEVIPGRHVFGYDYVRLGKEYTIMKCDVPKDKKRGGLDVVRTIKLLNDQIEYMLDNSSNYETFVIDSISDIRSIVASNWLLEYNNKNNSSRKSIGKDPSAWSAINKTVEDDMIFPIINTCRMENKNLILTCKMEDEYGVINTQDGKKDTAKTGKRQIDTQNWITFEVDVIARLESTEKGKYGMTVTKSPKGVIPYSDITNKSVYEIFMEKEIL